MINHFLSNLEKVFNTSPLLGLGVSFLAGFLASFSGCIYPLIPITLGVVGATTAASRLKGFFLSFIFVLGICVIYTILGITASLLGCFLGHVFINPFTYLTLSAIFVLLGLSVLDVIKLNIVLTSTNYTPGKTAVSLFILGMLSGLAIIPCNFPVLGTILAIISLKQNVVYGAVALFFFSLGYGLILIVLGTFTSLIRKLPKQGVWLVVIRKALGVVLLLVALYFMGKFIDMIR